MGEVIDVLALTLTVKDRLVPTIPDFSTCRESAIDRERRNLLRAVCIVAVRIEIHCERYIELPLAQKGEQTRTG